MKHNISNMFLKLMSFALLTVMLGCGREGKEKKESKGDTAVTKTTPNPAPTPTPSPTTGLEIQGSDISAKETKFDLSIKNIGTAAVDLQGYSLKAEVVEVDGEKDSKLFKGTFVKQGGIGTANREITVRVAQWLGDVPKNTKFDAGVSKKGTNRVEEIHIQPGDGVNSATVRFSLLDASNNVVATKQLKWNAAEENSVTFVSASYIKVDAKNYVEVDVKITEEVVKIGTPKLTLKEKEIQSFSGDDDIRLGGYTFVFPNAPPLAAGKYDITLTLPRTDGKPAISFSETLTITNEEKKE